MVLLNNFEKILKAFSKANQLSHDETERYLDGHEKSKDKMKGERGIRTRES